MSGSCWCILAGAVDAVDRYLEQAAQGPPPEGAEVGGGGQLIGEI